MTRRLDEARAAMAAYRATASATPPSLFDATQERDDAIRRTRASYDHHVHDALARAVTRLASTGMSFSADDVREELGELAGTVDLRVVGAALRRAARAGEIVAEGYVPSRYRHASPIRSWRAADGL